MNTNKVIVVLFLLIFALALFLHKTLLFVSDINANQQQIIDNQILITEILQEHTDRLVSNCSNFEHTGTDERR